GSATPGFGRRRPPPLACESSESGAARVSILLSSPSHGDRMIFRFSGARPILRWHATFPCPADTRFAVGGRASCPSESAAVLRYLAKRAGLLSPQSTATSPRFRG